MKEKYKYLDNTGFPYLDNVDIPPNTFDYSNWPVGTTIRILHVSWDRDYSNVVKFETDADRDRWTEEHTAKKYELDTAINLQPDGSIKLPIPFDVLARNNYITVSFAWAPVDFEENPRVRTIGYFIDNVQQLAPSTTEARLTLDYWYTYINELDVSYMMLERGHAPVAATDAEWYLENPIERNDLLLAPDITYGDERARIKQAGEWIANDGNPYAVFACTGNVGSNGWGTNGQRTMATPGIASADWFGLAGGLDYFAVSYNDLNNFIIQCNTHRPHFLQTVQAMFLVPGKLLDLGNAFTWANFTVSLYPINTTQKNYRILDLDKNAFGYPAEYADFAKLYTAPYAHLELTDENGNVSRIDIENTSGKLDVKAALNLVHPFAGLDVILIGSGGAETNTSNFGYGTTRQFAHGGDWYTTIKRYGIPSFVVSQSQNDRAQFNRFFENAQSTTALNNTLTSNLASNATSYDNTIRDIDNTTANVILSNDNNTYKVDTLQNAGSITQIGGTGDGVLVKSYDANLDKLSDDNDADQILMFQLSGLAQDMISCSAVINSAGSLIANTGNGLASGSIPGAISGIGSGITSAATTQAGAMLAITNNSNIVEKNKEHSDAKFVNARNNMMALTQAQIDYSHNVKEADNTLNTNTNTNNANTGRTNAAATKATSDANANRSADTSRAAIDNGNRSQGVQAPATYGSTSNAETAASRPMGYFVNIATQSKAGIKYAGDAFCRYGYTLGQNWNVDKLQVMKYFTYWRVSELWIGTRGQAIEDAADAVKRIFMQGVTVWDNPDKIGRVSIYDNVNRG